MAIFMQEHAYRLQNPRAIDDILFLSEEHAAINNKIKEAYNSKELALLFAEAKDLCRDIDIISKTFDSEAIMDFKNTCETSLNKIRYRANSLGIYKDFMEDLQRIRR